MRRIFRRRIITLLLLPGGLLSDTSVSAQVLSDGSLSTSVNQRENIFTIEQGDRIGNNLFHSFSQFSVPLGGAAIFKNATDIQSIFSRVTGDNPSSIDGVIQAQGQASLFLINPNGILFGPNARLNLGGAFLGTTAEAIHFADGGSFETLNPDVGLLSLSVPIGLQFGSNPGSIQNSSAVSSPFMPLPFGAGLEVTPGNSIALVGGAVSFERGAMSSVGGNIEIGAVGDHSLVGLIPAATGFELNYDQVSNFQDIRLAQSLVSATLGGQVQLQGRNIVLLDDSQIGSNTLDNTSAGDVTVKASESIQVLGISGKNIAINGRNSTGIYNGLYPSASGNVGNIFLSAPSIILNNGASVFTGVFSSSLNNVGNLGGDIWIEADKLQILNGSQIGAQTTSSRNAGNVNIYAKDVQLMGIYETNSQAPSSIFTTTQREGTGMGGTLTLEAERLHIADGGLVVSNTFGAGNAGELLITATEFIEVTGTSKDYYFPTGILSDASPLGVFGGDFLTGNSGEMRLTAKKLIVQDDGLISARNVGSGDAGDMILTAQSLILDNGTLTATVNAGNQGNIAINTDFLLMRDQSQIITSADSLANGGNITLNSPLIVGLNNSDISANAVQGRGGNIEIKTQGLFGFKFRDRLTPGNDITASSEFGVNGTVAVINPDSNPGAALIALPTTLLDSDQIIAQGCSPASQTSSFVATGRGGMPPNPSQQAGDNRPWGDVRDIAAYRHPDHDAEHAMIQPQLKTNTAKPLAIATHWRSRANGQVELLGHEQDSRSTAPATAPATCGSSA